MKDIIRKVTDAITIIFPALIALACFLQFAGVVDWLDNAYGVIVAALAVVSCVASVVFNAVTDIKIGGRRDG